MRILTLSIIMVSAFLLSGCSGGADEAYQTELAYYELCITTEADTYRTRFASGGGIPNPENGFAYTPFEYATVACEKFKP